MPVPTIYAFPAAQSAIAMGDPSDWQISKNNFSEPQKLFFLISPPDTLESRQWAFEVLFQLPKAQLQWETLPTGKFQKTIFQSLKSCFFDFPLPLRAGSELFRCFSSFPKRNCNGRTFHGTQFNSTRYTQFKTGARGEIYSKLGRCIVLASDQFSGWSK